MNFTKALLRFTVFISVLLAFCMLAVGALILLFPQLIWKIITYVVGGGLLLSGLVVIGSLLFALISPMILNRRQIWQRRCRT